jgi:hypothetical protein
MSVNRLCYGYFWFLLSRLIVRIGNKKVEQKYLKKMWFSQKTSVFKVVGKEGVVIKEIILLKETKTLHRVSK